MTVEDILKEAQPAQKDLIHILHRIRAEFGHIPPDSIGSIAKHLRISSNEVFGVLTFYKAFTLEPKGEHVVTVCLGTACHVRGGVRIVEEFERKLGIKAGRTTADRKFTLETVNCLGCCAIGPVVVVNGEYHSLVTQKMVDSILDKFRSAGNPS
ncbi:MAG: NAD(P)H-dependent oxidoreductase subunit E [Candidatus Aminicenantes bacterium]|nr:NAD(P)H-dependent oxidoreductase subunit E [Candidatus Aminicenantes bacterium]